jgi:tetratricopeptide (TPR) repeat protein
MALQDELVAYENALSILEASQTAASVDLQEPALDVLTARDAVHHTMGDMPAVPAKQLLWLNRLDDRLKVHSQWLFKTLDLGYWRSLLSPAENAWWWHPEPPALLPFLEKRYRWLDQLDWLWTFASLFFLTFSITVVLDTLNRVTGEGLNTQGMFPVVVQVLLTIAGGTAALTERGRNVLRLMMQRLCIPKHWWQEFSALASLIVLLIVLAIYGLYLPRLAADRYQDGIAHYSMGQFDSALQAYQQSLALQPDFVQAHYSLGLLYEDLQRVDEAIAEYELVVSQDPEALDKLTWLRAHNNLGRLYILNGDYSTAWIPLERAFSALKETELTDPDMQVEQYNLLKNLGWLWLGQEQFLEADEFLNQAIAQDSERAAAHCLQAQVLEGLEQNEAALSAWSSCLSGVRNIQAEEAEWAAMARARLEAE